MKQILLEWRKYLQEDSIDKITSKVEELVEFNKNQPEKDKTFVSIEKVSIGYKIYYSNSEGGEINHTPISGIVGINRPREIENCSNGLVIAYSEAVRGWGPLLYEVALEVASKQAGGLIPDRVTVSKYAEAVWEKYLQRPDVKNNQLDNLKNTLTPEKEDNCGQTSAITYSDEKNTYWSSESNPLSKIYKKDNKEVINLLMKHGLLIL